MLTFLQITQRKGNPDQRDEQRSSSDLLSLDVSVHSGLSLNSPFVAEAINTMKKCKFFALDPLSHIESHCFDWVNSSVYQCFVYSGLGLYVTLFFRAGCPTLILFLHHFSPVFKIGFTDVTE